MGSLTDDRDFKWFEDQKAGRDDNRAGVAETATPAPYNDMTARNRKGQALAEQSQKWWDDTNARKRKDDLAFVDANNRLIDANPEGDDTFEGAPRPAYDEMGVYQNGMRANPKLDSKRKLDEPGWLKEVEQSDLEGPTPPPAPSTSDRLSAFVWGGQAKRELDQREKDRKKWFEEHATTTTGDGRPLTTNHIFGSPTPGQPAPAMPPAATQAAPAAPPPAGPPAPSPQALQAAQDRYAGKWFGDPMAEPDPTRKWWEQHQASPTAVPSIRR